MSEPQRSAIVIGAGVIGLASAYALARKGIAVTVVDAESGPGMGTSYANGAQLSYCYADALASPAVIAALPRLVLGFDDAFRLHWHWDRDYRKWVSAFLYNCTAKRFRANTMAVLDLAGQSRCAMDDLQRLHRLEFGHAVAGKMHLYADPAEFARAKAILALKDRAGCTQQVLSPQEAVQREPGLVDGAERLAGVIYSPQEAAGNPHSFCLAMHALLTRDYGVRSVFGMEIDALSLKGGKAVVSGTDGRRLSADIAVLCTGSAAAKLLKPHGQSLLIQPMKGYSFEIPVGHASPRISITDTKRRIVFTNLGDRMRIAGLADLGAGDTAIDDRRMERLIANAKAALPRAGVYDSASNFWAGLRPMTPNSMPIISRPHPRLAINTGHGMLGWTLAMGSGERLAALI